MEEYKGPIGIWPFPILSKFFGPKYSINDHNVLAGAPNYISDYEIEVKYREPLFTLEMQYDCKIKTKYYHPTGGHFLYETEANIPAGQILTVSPPLLTSSGAFIVVLEQTAPR